MDRGERVPAAPKAKSWLEDTFRSFNFVMAIREREVVRRTSQRCLALYRRIESEQPDATTQQRYEFVVSQFIGDDPKAVRTALRRAEESFAAWPVERDLNFRDIVQYIAVTEYCQDNPNESGMRARVSSVVADLIPDTL
jgi:hypothetical protein